MGNSFTARRKNTESTIFMEGLHGAGKTSVVHKLKSEKNLQTSAAAAFYNVETVSFHNRKWTVWEAVDTYVEAGSRGKMGPIVRHYFPSTKGLVFVIDSSDNDQLDDAKYELKCLLLEYDLSHAKVVILANKQDLPNAMTVEYLTEYLELGNDRDRCNIFGTCATTGEGIPEALQWLVEAIDPGSSISQNQSTVKNSKSHGKYGYFQKGCVAIKKLFVS